MSIVFLYAWLSRPLVCLSMNSWSLVHLFCSVEVRWLWLSIDLLWGYTQAIRTRQPPSKYFSWCSLLSVSGSATGTCQSWSQHQYFWMGLFYYFISEFCVVLTLRCGDRESSLIQNGGLSAACCSTSCCVLVFSLCLPIGLVEITALPASSLDQFQYYLI